MLEHLFITALVNQPVKEKQEQLWNTAKESEGSCDGVEILGDEPTGMRLQYESGGVNGSFTGRTSLDDYPDEDKWWGIDGPHFDFDLEDLKLKLETDQRVEDFLTFVKYVYTAIKPSPNFIYGLPSTYTVEIYDDVFGLPVDKKSPSVESLDDINYTPWLMVFPPELVKSIGEETVRETPAWRVTELNDGGFMIVAYKDPLGNSDTSAVSEHLGLTDAWEDLLGI